MSAVLEGDDWKNCFEILLEMMGLWALANPSGTKGAALVTETSDKMGLPWPRAYPGPVLTRPSNVQAPVGP